jgi:hypothetical protein
MAGRALGPGEYWLPLATTYRGGSELLCQPDNPIGGPRATLLGSASDARLAWVVRDGQRYELGWPAGYTARFSPELEVLDDHSRLVASQGDQFTKLCPTADAGTFWLMSAAITRGD